MHKTTLYLSDDDASALRRLAAATGRSQADLIREAVRRVLGDQPARVLHSMGRGKGDGSATPRWDAAQLYDERIAK